jgi:hypothetical protein
VRPRRVVAIESDARLERPIVVARAVDDVDGVVARDTDMRASLTDARARAGATRDAVE